MHLKIVDVTTLAHILHKLAHEHTEIVYAAESVANCRFIGADFPIFINHKQFARFARTFVPLLLSFNQFKFCSLLRDEYWTE